MKQLTILVAGAALAGCGTIFEEDLDRATQNVQEWKQANVGQPARSAQQAQPAQPQASAAQGATTPTATDPQLVRKVQQELKAEGINPGPIDGIWGPKTSQAVQQFQQKRGLQASGQLDARTLSALGVAGGQTAAAGGNQESKETAAARAGTATRN